MLSLDGGNGSINAQDILTKWGCMILKNKLLHLVERPSVLVDGKRLNSDRRVFSYSEYFPERRSVKDRRCTLGEKKTLLYLVKRD